MQPVFRFAPSPNGYLHLGHAYSALLNQQLSRQVGGRLLLRIEDIDTIRCRPELVDATIEDARWLGIAWEEPVLRQSQHFPRYAAALETLQKQGLIYQCFCSRKEIAQAALSLGPAPPRDPDGALVYPGTCRGLRPQTLAEKTAAGLPFAWRLDIAKTLKKCNKKDVSWQDADGDPIRIDPTIWGDVVLGRKEMPTSYHLAVVLDDAMQGVSDVVRGMDLFHATAIHRILQESFGLPVPRYRHHPLLVDDAGLKLAKSRSSTPLRQLRAEGVSAAALRQRLGF